MNLILWLIQKIAGLCYWLFYWPSMENEGEPIDDSGIVYPDGIHDPDPDLMPEELRREYVNRLKNRRRSP